MANSTNSIADMDKDKIKMFFSMLGEVIAMFIGLFSIFKKNEKDNSTVEKKF